MSGRPLQVLVVEDSEDDFALLLRALRQGGFEPVYERVDTPTAFREALARRDWEFIIADYSLPKFSGREALRCLQESGRDIPFIIVSGTIGEDLAVEAMRAGAHD